ncbi:hypothetical protein NQ317_010279 [Molorchus minor]|uniref:Uncharacterized protein n=1 Tax=Molorchus minor TaxID=1323400 RepID=A0ABQ9J4D2_9CUCU|nr:hypothetical protein NQ317_010279 [Molorchus minor]
MDETTLKAFAARSEFIGHLESDINKNNADELYISGEYYVTKPAHPEPYVLLQSLEQTVHSLENKFKSKSEDLKNAEYAKYQLEERIRLLKGHASAQELSPETKDMPEKIKSEKGVALKVGEFYEILEFEEA